MTGSYDPPVSIENEDLHSFAKHLGLNESDCDLFWESYYDMDTEMNYLEEEYARSED